MKLRRNLKRNRSRTLLSKSVSFDDKSSQRLFNVLDVPKRFLGALKCLDYPVALQKSTFKTFFAACSFQPLTTRALLKST
jgi:hypothetical protein